jgi:hypothetical protein
MRYSTNRTEGLQSRHPASLSRGQHYGATRHAAVRPGQCDAQMSLALEPGTQRPAYVVMVKGDRLQEAGICHGDLVAIQKSGEGRRASVTVTRLDNAARDIVSRGSRLPEVTLWGKPLTLNPSQADIEGVFVGVLRQGRSLH